MSIKSVFLIVNISFRNYKRYATLLLTTILVASCKSRTTKTTDRPNFIVIYTDDQKFDGIGINDNKIIKTPSIDAQAKRGIQFSKANVAFSLCSPSRAALMTGRYGSVNRVLGLNSTMNSDEVTLPMYLKDEGYHTA